MSYILDALNKSEQERQQQKLPNLKTSHTPLILHSGHRPLLVVSMLILASLLLMSAAFAYWYINLRADATTSIMPGSSAGATAGGLQSMGGSLEVVKIPSNAESNIAPARVDQPVSGVASEPDEQVILPQILPPQRPTPSLDQSSIPDIVDLPVSVQEKIPTLAFSTHIYASEPGWRMVGINGKSRRQGDSITDSLRLIEITEGGVVLKYDNYIFRMSVLRDWSGR